MVNLVGTKISFSVFADFKEPGLKYALIKETEKVRSRGEEGWATQRENQTTNQRRSTAAPQPPAYILSVLGSDSQPKENQNYDLPEAVQKSGQHTQFLFGHH